MYLYRQHFSENGQNIDTIYVIRSDRSTDYKAPANNFTGNATVQRLFPASNNEMNISGGYVSF